MQNAQAKKFKEEVIAAAAKGDSGKLEGLLTEGASPDAKNGSGNLDTFAMYHIVDGCELHASAGSSAHQPEKAFVPVEPECAARAIRSRANSAA